MCNQYMERKELSYEVNCDQRSEAVSFLNYRKAAAIKAISKSWRPVAVKSYYL